MGATKRAAAAIVAVVAVAVVAVGLVGAVPTAGATGSSRHDAYEQPIFGISIDLSILGDYQPLVGDFDGDGYDDVFWYGPGAKHDGMWLGSRRDGNPFRSVATRSVAGTYRPIVGDFAGDRADDIFWYGPGGIGDSLWVMGVGRTSPVAVLSYSVGHDYRPVVLPDRYAIGNKEAILWDQPGAATDRVWTFRPGKPVGQPPIGATIARGAPGTRPIIGSFGGDGYADVFWYGPGSVRESVTGRTSPTASQVTASKQVGGSYRPIVVSFEGAQPGIFFAATGPNQDSYAWLGGPDTKQPVVAFSRTFETGVPVRIHAGSPSGLGDAIVRQGSSPERAWTVDGRVPTDHPSGNDAPDAGQIALPGNFGPAIADDLLLYSPHGRGPDRLMTNQYN